MWNWIVANKEWVFSGIGVLILAAVAKFLHYLKNLRGQYTAWEGDQSLIIRKVRGSVTLDEPGDRHRVSGRVILRGKVADHRGSPVTDSDVLVLVRSVDSDDWIPALTQIWPDSKGRWDTEIDLPPDSKEVEILALALPPKDTDQVRVKRKAVRFSKQFPRQADKIARLRLYHSPSTSQLVAESTRRRTDWDTPEVRDFLARSNLKSLAIDTAIAPWVCPSVSSDWGWKDDTDIRLFVEPNLINEDLPAELREISRAYMAEHKDKTDSVKYCVTEFVVEPSDTLARLILKVRPVTYLAAFPIMNTLMGPTGDQSFRMRWFHKMEERSRPLIPNTLDIQVLVVTGDNQLLLQRRRSDKELDFMRGRWSASIEEQLNAPWECHLSEDKVFHTARVPDSTVFEGFRRALREEIKLTKSEIENSQLRVLATGFEYDSFGTSLYAMAELPPVLTHVRLEERLLSSDEFDTLAWCSFDPATLKRTLLDSSPPANVQVKGKEETIEWRWHPSSRLRIALGLRRRIGEIELQRWLEY